MHALSSFSKTDRRLLYTAIIGVLLCIYFLIYDADQSDIDRTGAVQIGVIEKINNDARLKVKGAYSWEKASLEELVYIGDSIYSGKNSEVNVTLEKVGAVEIGENSLVKFETLNNQNLLGLESGQFKLNVNGKLKISIDGKITTIDGERAEIIIKLDKDKKPEIQVTKGKADFNKETNIVKMDQHLRLSPLNYKWQLYDLYVNIEGELFSKQSPPEIVAVTNQINWSNIKNSPAMIEWANNNRFQNKIDYQAPATGLDLNKAYVGDNYIRLSFDGQNWTKPQKFTLISSFANEVLPQVKTLNYRLPFANNQVSSFVTLQTKNPTKGYLVQASKSSSFNDKNSKLFWQSSNNLSVVFYKPGRYHYRVRGVNNKLEISDWSPTIVFDVYQSERPTAPLLTQNYLEGYVGDTFNLQWKANTKNTRLELFDSKNNKIKRFKGNSFSWIPKKAGEYKARVFQKNKYGVESPASQFVKILVKDKPLPIARMPAQTNKSVTQYEAPYRFLNGRYKNSQISGQGLLWTLQSTDLETNDVNAPIATGVGVKTYLWKGAHGFEGNIKSGVLGLNEAGREGVSLKSIEPRYHYRFLSQLQNRYVREVMYSVFAGAEIYRNSASNISNQYDLLKFGTALEFPILSRWTSGGEFVYGQGADGSTKYEISGNFNFFFEPKWSFGFGYRLHLFQAGAKEASPSGLLPYREGYTEGFSALNYHF